MTETTALQSCRQLSTSKRTKLRKASYVVVDAMDDDQSINYVNLVIEEEITIEIGESSETMESLCEQ